MSDMTPEKAKDLRKPFPPESVGKLPKPYRADSQKGNCGECGGYHGLPAVHLDYVGHAAVTDRLLTVDPNWSWEPFSLDASGLPAMQGGNMWIRLTICGVTRIGVGDGKSAKECIGDAIRNAAMRFGVGLDLWAKENLVEFAQAAQAHQRPTTEAAVEVAVDNLRAAGFEPEPTDDLLAGLEAQVAQPIQPKTRAAMFAEFARVGITDQAQQLAGINAITGQSYTSRGDLTDVHAKAVIADLKKRPAKPAEMNA